MKKHNTNRGRRSALKSAGLISSSVIAGQALPTTWQKPIINSIILPSHGQTTQSEDSAALAEDAPPSAPPPENPCSGDSITINADQFAVNVVYDTVSAATFFIRNGFRTRFSDDSILAINKAPTIAVGLGGNWETGTPRLERNVADGLYTRTSRRMVDGKPTGDTYEITFCIATSGAQETRQATLTLVSINKI